METPDSLLFQRNIAMVTTDPSDKDVRIPTEPEPRRLGRQTVPAEHGKLDRRLE